jgi:peptide/nickel transport system permease protein
MIRFLVKRIAFAGLVLLLISMFVFFLFYIAPGDPAREIAGQKASPEVVAQIRSNLGLDQPIYQQYGRFISKLLHGDLGISYRNQMPVLDTILDRAPATLSLVLGGVVVWLLVGVSIGIASATHPRSLRDRVGQSFVMAGLSFPTFVLGMLSLYLLYYLPTKAGVHLFPSGGYVPLTQDAAQWAWHLVLPWTTLAFVMAAVYARLTRGQMLEVLGEDYIRTARAKGLPERRVVYVHAMRSAITPLLTQLGADVGVLLGGVIVIEQVYGILGIGNLAVNAVYAEDRPVVIGVVLFAATCVVAANIVVDVCYALLDARVRVH